MKCISSKTETLSDMRATNDVSRDTVYSEMMREPGDFILKI